MKIGIIGSGNMGRTLGLFWMEHGHEVFFGSRGRKDIDYIREVYSGPLNHGSIHEAITFGEVLFYSLRDTMPTAVAPAELWWGKIVIDCNNGPIPPDFNYPAQQQSYTERYQENIPEAKIVKAFNTNAQELFNHSPGLLHENDVIGLMAGDDPEAKQIVATLLRDAGLKPIDAGMAYNARLLESFADLIRMLMIKNNLGPYLVFKTDILPTPAHESKGQRQPTNYQ
jgi:8-hydroxy-5-deazaflavin:NADPH oxidoreductase